MDRHTPRTVRCPGCDGLVPDGPGPVHAYMRSTPGCWALFVEPTTLPDAGRSDLRVDAFAAQHPGGAEVDRRQRQSVAVHLVALCLVLDLDLARPPLEVVRGRTSQLLLVDGQGWPFLAPPDLSGRLTVSDLVPVAGATAATPGTERWAADVWDAWGEHHGTVRAWAERLREAVP